MVAGTPVCVLATTTIVGNRYLLGEIIGRGGGADVFRAEDTETGKPVAVKVLRSATTDDLRRFDLEAETLSRLNHPAIVRMCDRGAHEGVPYLVLDLIEGEPLSTVVKRHPMSEGEVMRVGGVLAGALAHAHGLGIVHRDVKPGNVLFDQSGEVHLTDFGIARLTDVTAITSKGLVIGTAAYLAPEQVNGDGAGPASDVYALGLVLIEALAGEPAFTGTASEAALARLQRSPEVPETASPELRMLLTAMTAADPDDRPSASAVRDSLVSDATTVLPVAGDVTQAIPIGPDTSRVITPMSLSAPLDRKRLALWLAIGALLLLMVVGWATSGSLHPNQPAPPPQTTAPPTTAAAPADTAPPDTTPPHPKKKKGD